MNDLDCADQVEANFKILHFTQSQKLYSLSVESGLNFNFTLLSLRSARLLQRDTRFFAVINLLTE